MASTFQHLKAFGHLPNVSLTDVKAQPMLALNVEDDLLSRRAKFPCGHPDEGDEEIAAQNDPGRLASLLDLDEAQCAGLIKQHQRMVAFAKSGRGSWPKSCHDDIPGPHVGRHAATYHVDYDTFKNIHTRKVTERDLNNIDRTGVWRWDKEEIFDLWSGKPLINVALDLMVESYRIWGVKMVEVDTGYDGEHNIHIMSQFIAGSTIGFAYFNNGTCGDHVTNHIDNSWDGGLMGMSRLLTHEVGHNMNLQHEFNRQSWHHSVMGYDPPDTGLFYGFWRGGDPVGLPEDRSIPELREFFGGEPIPLADGPVLPDPPDTGSQISGELTGEIFDGNKVAIRGFPVANGLQHMVVPVPGSPGKYRFVRKVL